MRSTLVKALAVAALFAAPANMAITGNENTTGWLLVIYMVLGFIAGGMEANDHPPTLQESPRRPV